MRVAVASGKGGTGKTTVAVNLALAAPGPVRLLDCDVEEPNCHIFLKPQISETAPVNVAVPEVDYELCNGCGECASACEFNAIVALRRKPLVFPELCHGCGGCVLACSAGAVREVPRQIGVVVMGSSGALGFVQGRLNVGEPMAPPVIRAVKAHAGADGTVIIDCPPGTSCPLLAAVRDTDYALLVTEPTPFGLHDLTITVEALRQLDLPLGVVINRADVGDARTRDYCRCEGIPVLLEIPDDRRVAEAYSRGEPALDSVPGMKELLGGLVEELSTICGRPGG